MNQLSNADTITDKRAIKCYSEVYFISDLEGEN